jgi:hypothetical protein
MGRRLTWGEIRRNASYRGRWVALDRCRYDDRSQPVEGEVVDADEDLASLCARIQQRGQARCAILFCDEADGRAARAVH